VTQTAEERRISQLAAGARYRARNREVILVKRRVFYQANQERLCAEGRAYAEANAGTISERRHS